MLWRESSDRPEELVFNVNYLGGDYPMFNLKFSRPGGPVVAQYYEFLRLGREGYARVHDACYDTAGQIAEAVSGAPGFVLLHGAERRRGMPAVTWRIAKGAGLGFNLFDLADRLRTHGRLVPAYTLPAELQEQTVQRVIVRHGFSRALGTHLMADLRRELATLDRHPPTASMTEAEPPGMAA